MDSTGIKSARLAAIEALPTTMQDDALVDWPTVKVLCNFADTEHARKIITGAGVPYLLAASFRDGALCANTSGPANG